MIAAAILAAACLLVTARAQSPIRVRTLPLSAASVDAGALRRVDDAIASRLRDGRLRLTSRRFDSLIDGVEHHRLQQVHQGVPVWASEVALQVRGSVPVSAFGGVFENLDDLGTAPALSAGAARAIVARAAGVELGPFLSVMLVVHVDEGGVPRLAYTMRATTRSLVTYRYFVDAQTAAVIEARLDTRMQSAVGVGRGVIEDTKKVSALRLGGAFVLADRLRPQETLTYDLGGDLGVLLDVLNGARALTVADLGVDADNTWTDPALVDAHVYAGWTADYMFKRFNRTAVFDQALPITNIVHPVRQADYAALGGVVPQFFANAGYFGGGISIFGVGLPPGVATDSGQGFTFLSGAIDVVAHEVAHGLTEHLEYRGESGALTETLSDVIGTSVEFFHQRQGGGRGSSDYQIGEDVVTSGAIRSMANPPAIDGHPNLFQNRRLDPADNGSVHANAGIGNQAFFLAIEGGPHPATGYVVPGVGPANREQIERIFYRGIAEMLPAGATWSMARAATIQAARDLYGAGSAAATAITEAWSAVGVP